MAWLRNPTISSYNLVKVIENLFFHQLGPIRNRIKYKLEWPPDLPGQNPFTLLSNSISFISLRIRGSAELPPLEFDCLACSNKRFNKKWIVLGVTKFQIQEEIGPVLFV